MKSAKQLKSAKHKSAAPRAEPRLQYGALPWRAGGHVEILLVSSRQTHRWIIPKGWPMKGRRPHAAAAREALEEAGLVGHIGKTSVGAYHYSKRAADGRPLSCKVIVFPLDVTRQRKSWPERASRTTKWFSLDEAAQAVAEPELRRLIEDFGRRIAQRQESEAPT